MGEQSGQLGFSVVRSTNAWAAGGVTIFAIYFIDMTLERDRDLNTTKALASDRKRCAPVIRDLPDFNATIIITSLHSPLLAVCRSFIPKWASVFVIDGSHGRYGMRAIKYVIDHAPCDRAVLLDEDAFIFDFARLQAMVRWTVDTRTACVGLCDGGVLPIRVHNPNALNPFFNIIDLAQIRDKWNEADCRSQMHHGSKMRELVPPEHILTPGVPYRFDDYEEYYCFYFWLHSAGLSVEWLTGTTHVDGVSTLLNDRARRPFLLHTWYGRWFGSDPYHTRRIARAALWAAARRDTGHIDEATHESQ